MRLTHVTIMVNNMDESLCFYQNIVGLPIVNRFQAGPDQEIVFLGEGETLVELIYNRNIQNPNIGQDISIGFGVKNLDESLDFIKEKKMELHSGPFQPNETTRFFFVEDPNGLKIQFIEQNNIV